MHPLAQRAEYYLGFDPATKTFAWSLSRINLGGAAGLTARWHSARAAAAAALADAWAAARAAVDTQTFDSSYTFDAARAAVGAAARSLDDLGSLAADITGRVRILAGAVADLAPGVADADLPTVARVRAVVGYIRDVVRPAVARLPPLARAPGEAPPPLRVVVEYQLGDNSPARAVATVIVAMCADDDVVFLGPSLKNQIALDASLWHGAFMPRYARTYDANKHHARANFARAEAVFGTAVAATSASARGHIADSFMQVLGMLVHGDGHECDRF